MASCPTHRSRATVPSIPRPARVYPPPISQMNGKKEKRKKKKKKRERKKFELLKKKCSPFFFTTQHSPYGIIFFLSWLFWFLSSGSKRQGTGCWPTGTGVSCMTLTRERWTRRATATITDCLSPGEGGREEGAFCCCWWRWWLFILQLSSSSFSPHLSVLYFLFPAHRYNSTWMPDHFATLDSQTGALLHDVETYGPEISGTRCHQGDG